MNTHVYPIWIQNMLSLSLLSARPLSNVSGHNVRIVLEEIEIQSDGYSHKQFTINIGLSEDFV